METSLIDLRCGIKAVIKRLEGGAVFQKKLESLNVRIGKEIKKVTKQPFNGPVVIEIDNTKVAIGREMASRIFVEEE